MRDLAPETVIDQRYSILSRIGSGGMADVYCAQDLQLGRKVALKLLYRRFAEDEEFVERFSFKFFGVGNLQAQFFGDDLRQRRLDSAADVLNR